MAKRKLTEKERMDLWLLIRENFPERTQTEWETMYKRLIKVGKKLYVYKENGQICRVGVFTSSDEWDKTYYCPKNIS